MAGTDGYDPIERPAEARSYAIKQAWLYASLANHRYSEGSRETDTVTHVGQLWAEIANSLRPVI